jgi:hypothetical protein
MSDDTKKISEMEPLLSLKNDDMMEVVRLKADGSYGNYRTQVSKLRVGQSVYDIAVQNGYVGTEQEYLQTLVGKSAYQIAAASGQFTGTEEEWLLCMEAIYSMDATNAGKVLIGDAAGIAKFGSLTAKDVGLEKVDNTPDADKPISKETQKALDKMVPRSKLVTLVMEILVGLPGFNLVPEDKSIRIDASIINGLEDFETKSGVDTKLNGYVKTTAMETAMEGLITETAVDTKLESYVTETKLEEAMTSVVTTTTFEEAMLEKVNTDTVGVTIATLVDGKVPAEQLP